MDIDHPDQDFQTTNETYSSSEENPRSTSATTGQEHSKVSDASKFAFNDLSFNEPPKPEKKRITIFLKDLGCSVASLKKLMQPRFAGILQARGRLNVPVKYSNYLKDLMETPEIVEAFNLISVCESPQDFDFVVTTSSAWRLKDEHEFQTPNNEYWQRTFSYEVLRKSFFLMLLAILKCDDHVFLKHVKLCRTFLPHEELIKVRFAVWDFFINLVPNGAEEEIKHLRDRIPNI